jgi:arylsulfatase
MTLLFRFTAAVLMLAAAPAGAQDVLPRLDQAAPRTIGRTPEDSGPQQWPQETKAPAGAPNILVIMTDDVGFGASSTFGGPIPTPTFDRLAKDGLRYNQFHVTALCSPTRAALLTGRNNHRVGVGLVEEVVLGYDGYTGVIPKSAGTVAEVLRESGYATSIFGKWHLVPYAEMSPAGPFTHWPTHMGFDYSYAFLGGETDQFAPAMFEGTRPVEAGQGDRSYTLDRDLADHAVAWIRQQKALAPGKPFFMYYAPGTTHAPHQAPKDWIARFKGRFDEGWDKLREETFERQKKLGIIPADTKLAPKPPEIPAWDSLPSDRKQVYARMMEVYAAALSHADYQIGRVIDALRDAGELDNTLVIYIQGDNGASAEGGPAGLLNDVTLYNGLPEDFANVRRHLDDLGGPLTNEHYPAGWALALDSPFQYYKQIASHFGGTQDGMVISWPRRIKDKGQIRSQFHHVIDIAPTILDAAGVKAPAILDGVPQKPLDGVSMIYTFDDPKASSRRRIQYFETLRNLGIYQDGWAAGTTPKDLPWDAFHRGKWSVDDQRWELYHVADDFSEAVDLAAKEPRKLRQLQDLFWAEAARNDVLPIVEASREYAAGHVHVPKATDGQSIFTFYPGMRRIPESAAPDLKNRSFELTADIDVGPAKAEGILLTEGDRFGGFSFFLQNGKPVYVYNMAGQEYYRVTADEPVSAGHHVVTLRFKYDGGGRGKGGEATILIDGKAAGSGRIERTLSTRFTLDASLSVGEATGTPVTDDYTVPFKQSAILNTLTVTLQ